MKYQLHPKFMFFLLFILDILYNITRESIAIATSDGKKIAIATIFFFCFFGGSLFCLAFLVLCCTIKHCASFISWLVQVFIVELYYYGSNINSIMQKYGNDIGCGETCQESNRVAAIVFLGTALIFLNTIPILHEATKNKFDLESNDVWNYVLNVITILVSINTIYSTVASLIPTSIHCTVFVVTLSSIFIILATVIGWASIIGLLWDTSYAKAYEDIECPKLFIFPLLLSLPLYLLSDNQLPIDCAFDSDPSGSNTTMTNDGDLDINYNNNSDNILRLIFTGITGTAVLISFLWKWCKKDED